MLMVDGIGIWAFGAIGLACILVGWIPQTLRTLRMKSCDLQPSFAILYFIGSAFLVFHSLVISDWVFLMLNLSASIIAAINIFFCFGKNKKVVK